MVGALSIVSASRITLSPLDATARDPITLASGATQRYARTQQRPGKARLLRSRVPGILTSKDMVGRISNSTTHKVVLPEFGDVRMAQHDVERGSPRVTLFVGFNA